MSAFPRGFCMRAWTGHNQWLGIYRKTIIGTYTQLRVFKGSIMHVCSIWNEARVPGENLRTHNEAMQESQSQDSNFEPQNSVETLVITANPDLTAEPI